ncbi:MAG: MerR family transcriptional regulator [Actinomycetota bacterium]
MAALPERMLTVRAVAREIGVHENTIRNWEARGVLKAIRLPVSGYRRFDMAQVERMKKEMLAQLAPADTGPVVEPKVAFPSDVINRDTI